MSGRVALLAVATLLAVAGCGGDVASEPVGEPPSAAAPTVPVGPEVLGLASGAFADGVEWRLTWETTPGRRGALCVAFADAEGDVHECARSSGTWFVSALRRRARHVVYATLPCGVTRVELRRRGRVVDARDTVAADDAMLAVLAGPASLADVTLVALAHDGRELFALGGLDGDPAVPVVGC